MKSNNSDQTNSTCTATSPAGGRGASSNRRQFFTAAAGAITTSSFIAPNTTWAQAAADDFKLKFMVASCMYGYAPLREILPEIARIGVDTIDLWPKVHGSQREELDSLGEEAFRDLLEQHGVSLGCLSQYKLGPFALQSEIQLAKRLECPVIVTAIKGGKGLNGFEQREAIDAFAKKMQPEFARAADANVTIAIENHGSSLIENVDGIRWLIDACEGPGFGFALAPAHLPQQPDLIAQLIRDAGDRLKLFYAWQYGKGFRKQMHHGDEMMQMPGRGPLDFGPLVSALKEIRFDGPTEVMMHPTPRGIPIEPTNRQVTEAIDASHRYLDQLTV